MTRVFKYYKVLINHQPLDFFDAYSQPVEEWIKKGSLFAPDGVPSLSLTERINCFQKATTALEASELDMSQVELRHEPRVYLCPKDMVSDEGDNDILAWFIFKEENNGTTHKVGVLY